MGSARSRRIGQHKLPDPRARWRWLVAATVAIGCGGRPHVSPWGTRDTIPLRAYVETPDLAARAAAIEDETAALGLALEREARVTDRSGVGFVIRGYVGRDSLDRPVHACRVATDRGVVLAVGPPAESDPEDLAAEWAPAMDAGNGRVVASPGYLHGDDGLDLVLRSRGGTLAIYALGPQGARALEIDLRAPPTRLVDLGEDGLAVAGDVDAPTSPGEPTLRLEDVATIVPAGFSDRAKGARAHHARERDAHAVAAPGESSRARADRRLTWAWHGLLAGDDPAPIFSALEEEPPTAAAQAELARRLKWLRRATE